MNESLKTMGYLGLAAAAIALAVATYPAPPQFEVAEQVNKPIFQEFTDAASAASMEVTELDEELAELKTFEVARKRGEDVWVIPSKDDYPADAEERLFDAATMFVDLRVIDVASTEPDEHSILGVMDPSASREVQEEGAGKLVRIEDRNGELLADLVIGNVVPGRENLRFVRRPSQDAVFVVEIDPDRVSTQFRDWIEKDLLDINPFDVQRVRVNDYSVTVRGQQGLLDRRFEMLCKFENNKWGVDEFRTYNGQDATPATLSDNEELNQQALNDLKNALRDLEIVDVEPKPAGLGENLKTTADFLRDGEGLASLAQRGFYPQPVGQDAFELVSANGELTVTTRDGVQYLMRFGDVAGNEQDSNEKLTRFMFVTTSVDESMFPMPEKPEGLDDPAQPAAPAPSSDAGDATAKEEEPATTDEAPSDSDDCGLVQDPEPGPDSPKEDPKQDPPKDEPAKEDPKQDPPKDETPKEDPKQDPPKDEPAKEDPKQDPPKDETPKQDPPKDETPKEEPKQDPPKDDMPKEEPKQDPPKDETPKEEPKQDPPKDETPKEEPKQDPPKDETPKEDPKQDPPKNETPKEEPKQDPPKDETPKEEPKQDHSQGRHAESRSPADPAASGSDRCRSRA